MHFLFNFLAILRTPDLINLVSSRFHKSISDMLMQYQLMNLVKIILKSEPSFAVNYYMFLIYIIKNKPIMTDHQRTMELLVYDM